MNSDFFDNCPLIRKSNHCLDSDVITENVTLNSSLSQSMEDHDIFDEVRTGSIYSNNILSNLVMIFENPYIDIDNIDSSTFLQRKWRNDLENISNNQTFSSLRR